MAETPENRPWCVREGACVCFGTCAPSTALRGGKEWAEGQPRCVHFRVDGGTTPTLRGLR